jgi:hypothetical protein
MAEEDAIDELLRAVQAGEHWYTALLQAMSRWSRAEELVGDRTYRYLIGGDAFDWLTLAERLLEALGGAVPPAEADALLFEGQAPLELDEEEFQRLIGTPKHQAYLNYLYGVVVEEALQQAVEEEVAKEMQAHVWANGSRTDEGAFQRLYGRGRDELLADFRAEKGLPEGPALDLTALKEFTYWLFKHRVRSADGARVASDTRKGLTALSRMEAASRRRRRREPEEE